MRVKTVLYQLHKWAGLSIAAFLLVQSVTGILLVFKEELRSSVFRDRHRVTLQATHWPITDIVATAKMANPGDHLDRLILPRAPDRAVIARYLSEGGGYKFATLDPYTGKVLHGGSYSSFPLETALFIHHELLLGPPGQWIVRFVGVSLVILGVTGFILGWPGFKRLRRTLVVRFSGPYLSVVFGLHKTVGLVMSMLLLITALTGTIIAWRPIITAGDVLASSPAPVALEVDGPISLDAAGDRVRSVLSGAELRDIRFSRAGADAVFFTVYDDELLNPRGIHQAQVNLANGQITFFHPSSRRSGKEVLLDWMLPIHTGEALRIVGRLLILLTGISLLIISTTGVLVWMERRQIRSRKRVSKVVVVSSS